VHPVKVRDFDLEELSATAAGPGIRLRTGPLVARIQTRLPAVIEGLALHYAEHPVEAPDAFADFHLRVWRPRGLRRWVRPQVVLSVDDVCPFKPLPLEHAFPMLEWGLNWCVTSLCHHFLAIHAAVVERRGRALVIPGPPGAGKSTLCAGLVHRGWRLLSDELALFDPATRCLAALARPVSLKNGSIPLLREFSADVRLGPAVADTIKGLVAHMKPPPESVRRSCEAASPRWVVVPRHVAGEAPALVPISRARAFMHLVENAFNYSLYGRQGFELLAEVTEACDCHALTYGDLEEACAMLTERFDRE
jgi:HprK-related kinase A